MLSRGRTSAAVSITRHFEVFSKVKGGQWYRVVVDLDEVCAGKHTTDDGLVIAPEAEMANLPAWILKTVGKRSLDQGTVVLLLAPDRLTTGFRKPKGFHNSMMEHLGLIYRGMLNRCALFLNEQRVEPVDPLFLDPNARFYDVGNDVSAQGREPLQFAMRNARTGGEGMVRLRFSYMPPEFQRNKDGSENKERLGVMKDNNAYLIVTRAGRQIDLVMRSHYPKDDLNKKNLNIFDRNWAVELDFDPELDEEFGITVNKQQVNPQVEVETPDEIKRRIRAGHLLERDAQLPEASVAEFIKGMEQRRLGPSGWVCVYSLMRDGRELAAKLRTAANARLDDERGELLRAIISPYLQVVETDAMCPVTGLKLTDIWRYFRHTWVSTYKSLPGRSMMVLVR